MLGIVKQKGNVLDGFIICFKFQDILKSWHVIETIS